MLLLLLDLHDLLHLEPALDHSDVQSVEIAFEVDPLICFPVQCLAIKFVLTDHVLFVRLFLQRWRFLALNSAKHWPAAVQVSQELLA